MNLGVFSCVGMAALVAGVCGVNASAATLNVSANVGTRSASASFAVSGTDLIVTLSNISLLDANVPTDMLTGVYFDVSGSPLSLTRTSALLNSGSVVVLGSQPSGGVVGGEFAYLGGLSGAPHGAAYGISSSGLGLFGPGDLFPGANLDGPTSPDGPQFSITSIGDNPLNNNGGASVPLIQNSVVFTLSGLPLGFDPSGRISNISFQYGTDLSEPNIQVPAPGAAALLGLGGLAAIRRRRR